MPNLILDTWKGRHPPARLLWMLRWTCTNASRKNLQRHARRTRVSANQLYLDLHRRGLVQKNDEGHDALTRHLEDKAGTERKTVYLGIDPTASSLHVGHLLPLMVLVHFRAAGHNVIPLIGGATSLVGDPTGRHSPRDPSYLEKVDANVTRLIYQLQKFFANANKYISKRDPSACAGTTGLDILNNAAWHSQFSLLDFLREVGTFAKLQPMLSKESVRARMDSSTGMLFSEFTYQLLQAYDFFKLHKERGCTIQVGGSDQWGNILAGIELISRKLNNAAQTGADQSSRQAAFGVLTPLLTSASGAKFGKSAGNAVWLDSEQTSIFDFYQFFLRIGDAEVESLLLRLTFLNTDRVSEVIATHRREPEKRAAQMLLAQEITELIHGEEAVTRAEAAAQALFGSNPANTRAQDVIPVLEKDKQLHYVNLIQMFDHPVGKLALEYGLVASDSEAKRVGRSGGLYLNGASVGYRRAIEPSDLIDNKMIIIRVGKTKHVVLALGD